MTIPILPQFSTKLCRTTCPFDKDNVLGSSQLWWSHSEYNDGKRLDSWLGPLQLSAKHYYDGDKQSLRLAPIIMVVYWEVEKSIDSLEQHHAKLRCQRNHHSSTTLNINQPGDMHQRLLSIMLTPTTQRVASYTDSYICPDQPAGNAFYLQRSNNPKSHTKLKTVTV